MCVSECVRERVSVFCVFFNKYIYVWCMDDMIWLKIKLLFIFGHTFQYHFLPAFHSDTLFFYVEALSPVYSLPIEYSFQSVCRLIFFFIHHSRRSNPKGIDSDTFATFFKHIFYMNFNTFSIKKKKKLSFLVSLIFSLHAFSTREVKLEFAF